MVAAIVLAGIWGIWKALVQRRYTQTAASLAVSVLLRAGRAVLRLPARAHDRPGEPVGQPLSLAFLSGANRGTVDDPEQAKREVADQLFSAQICSRGWC